MSEHTPEPWEDLDFYLDISMMVVGEHVLPIPDYNRARACVNALAGMNPEVVQQMRNALAEAEVMLRGARAFAPKSEILDAVIEQVQSALSAAQPQESPQ